MVVKIKTTMEVWKDVVGFEEYYEVSTYGNLRSKERKCNGKFGLRVLKPKLLKLHSNEHGYKIFMFKSGTVTKHQRIHRVVAEAFIENPLQKDFVNHIDGNKSNNTVENLEWVTRSENELHAHAIGLKTSPFKGKTRGACHNSKKVINNQTGEIFGCIQDAADSISKTYGYLKSRLNGTCINNTFFTFYQNQ